MNSVFNFLPKLIMASAFFAITFAGFSQANLDIKSLQKEAKGYFEIDEFANALPLYRKLDSLKPNDIEVQYRLGVCNFYIPGNRKKSLSYFEKVRSSNLVYKDLDYYLGCLYQLEHKFDLAILNFESFKKISDKKLDRIQIPVAEIDRHIKECNTGKTLMANPIQLKIENIGNTINSVYNEYAPVVSADETELIFTSRRPNTTGGKRDEEGDGDLEEFKKELYAEFMTPEEAANGNSITNDERTILPNQIDFIV